MTTLPADLATLALNEAALPDDLQCAVSAMAELQRRVFQLTEIGPARIAAMQPPASTRPDSPQSPILQGISGSSLK